MKITHMVGIDVSKLTLDYHHYNGLEKAKLLPMAAKGTKHFYVG